MPQPVAMDVQGFMPQTNLLDETVKAAEISMKLPLLRAQVEFDQKKLKAEKAQLEFLESDADLVRRRHAADLEAQVLLNEQLRLSNLMDRPLTSTDVGVPADPVAPSTTTTPAPALVAPTPSPDSRKLFPEISDLDRALPSDAVIANSAGEAVQQVQAERQARDSQFLAGARTIRQQVEARAELASRDRDDPLRAKPTTLEVRGGNGIPFVLDVWDVDGRTVVTPDALNTARVDLEKLPPGQKRIDEAFAKEIGESIGPTAVTDANRENLQYAREALEEAIETGDPKISGRLVGVIPEALRPFIPGFAKGVDVREAVLQVVQQNLKATLGGQFAMREADLLFKRAFNEALPPEANLRRLNLLAQQMDQVAAVSQDMLGYFIENGTLAGKKWDLEARKRLIREMVLNPLEELVLDEESADIVRQNVANRPTSGRTPAPGETPPDAINALLQKHFAPRD